MITLSDFISYMGQAGVEAAKACEAYALNRLQAMFDEDEDGTLIPKMVKLKMPSGIVEVPQVTLMSPVRVDLDQVEYEFETTVSLGKDGCPNVLGHTGLIRKGVKVKAKVKFGAHENLESIELIRERCNKKLSTELSLGD